VGISREFAGCSVMVGEDIVGLRGLGWRIS
jgi:hypothetical protein